MEASSRTNGGRVLGTMTSARVAGRCLRLAAAVLAGLAAGSARAPSADAAPSSQDGPSHTLFKVDPARTGHLPDGPQPPLQLLWKFKTREDASKIEKYPTVDDGLSPAVVASGVVYVGGHDGWVYAIDARSGRKLWDFRTRDHVMTTPTLHDGRLYVGSMDGFVYALDARSGAVLWQYESGYKLWNNLNYGGVRASPVILGGNLIFGG